MKIDGRGQLRGRNVVLSIERHKTRRWCSWFSIILLCSKRIWLWVLIFGGQTAVFLNAWFQRGFDIVTRSEQAGGSTLLLRDGTQVILNGNLIHLFEWLLDGLALERIKVLTTFPNHFKLGNGRLMMRVQQLWLRHAQDLEGSVTVVILKTFGLLTVTTSSALLPWKVAPHHFRKLVYFLFVDVVLKLDVERLGVKSRLLFGKVVETKSRPVFVVGGSNDLIVPFSWTIFH